MPLPAIAIIGGAFIAAGLAGSLASNRKAQKLENENTELEVANAKLQAAEAAYERTKQYRQNASMNLALSGMGVGSANSGGALAAESFQNYLADIQSINMAGRYAALGGKQKKKASSLNKYSRNFGAAEGAGESLVGLATKLNLFGAK